MHTRVSLCTEHHVRLADRFQQELWQNMFAPACRDLHLSSFNQPSLAKLPSPLCVDAQIAHHLASRFEVFEAGPLEGWLDLQLAEQREKAKKLREEQRAAEAERREAERVEAERVGVC